MLFAIEHPRLAMISQLQWTQRETKIQVRSKGLLVRADVGVEKLCGERMLEKHVFFLCFSWIRIFRQGKDGCRRPSRKSADFGEKHP